MITRDDIPLGLLVSTFALAAVTQTGTAVALAAFSALLYIVSIIERQMSPREAPSECREAASAKLLAESLMKGIEDEADKGLWLKARIDKLEFALHDPATGLSERVRRLSNETKFK
jgi:hypothetical protein